MVRPLLNKPPTHPILLRCPADLFQWISKEAEARRWSNPTFIRAILEDFRKQAEEHSDN